VPDPDNNHPTKLKKEHEVDLSKLTETLPDTVRDQDFSGVIRVRQGDKSVFEGAYGYADRANHIENRPDTRFGIASGTKFFTALAIGKLIEDGQLDFDTRIEELVDLGYPQYAPEITIRHLLTHTSGIPDYYDEEKITEFDGFTVAVPWSELRGPRDYLAVFPDEPMKFAPGARFSYSNGGYIVLGIVIEELSGTGYQDFVAGRVFEPVGMTDSGYFAMNKLPARTAFGYVEEEDGWRTNIYDLPIIGASDGGAFTTVEDMTKLWDAFWAGEILSPEMVAIYAEPYAQAGAEGEHITYGHGLWIYADETRGVRETYIEGCDAGVSFRSGRSREQELEVTVISNTTGGAWPVLGAIDEITRQA
jgi:CubicO group peptidase (beta-lactamase class C family)